MQKILCTIKSLLNGTSVIFKGGNSADKQVTFMVDTNGPLKPNTWGRDVFEFDYSERYGLVLDGNPAVGDVTAWNGDGACKKLRLWLRILCCNLWQYGLFKEKVKYFYVSAW